MTFTQACPRYGVSLGPVAYVTTTHARSYWCISCEDRLAAFLDHPTGELEQFEIKGKQDPVPAHRARWFATDG